MHGLDCGLAKGGTKDWVCGLGDYLRRVQRTSEEFRRVEGSEFRAQVMNFESRMKKRQAAEYRRIENSVW